MTRKELKQLIRETIEGIQSEAAVPAGTTYTFNQLNKLIDSGKATVLIKNTYDKKLIEIPRGESFFMAENNDGEQTVHTTDGETTYEYGVEFVEVYVAQKVNVK